MRILKMDNNAKDTNQQVKRKNLIKKAIFFLVVFISAPSYAMQPDSTPAKPAGEEKSNYISTKKSHAKQQEVEKAYALAQRNRSYPPTVWIREVLRLIPYTMADADIKICLHHLAGNAIHIIRMHMDNSYFQAIRTKEMSNTIRVTSSLELVSNYKEPSDVVKGRSSKEDLKKIVKLLQEGEKLNQNPEKTESFLSEVRRATEDLEVYRIQRKLEFKRHIIANPLKAGHDDGEPNSIELVCKYPKFKKLDLALLRGNS